MPLPSSPITRNPRRSRAPESQRQPPRLHRQDVIGGSGEEPEPSGPPNQDTLELTDTPGARHLIRLLTRTRPNVWRREHIAWVLRGEFYQRRRTLNPPPRSDQETQEQDPEADDTDKSSNTPTPPSRPSNEAGPDKVPVTNHDEQALRSPSTRQRPSSLPPPYATEREQQAPATSQTEQPLAPPGPVCPIELPDTVGVNVFISQIVLTDPNHPFASAV